jgi:hypothetical protein
MPHAAPIALAVTLIASSAIDAHAQSPPPQWSMRATGHFDIYFHAAQQSRVDAIAREAEGAYARISNLLRYRLAARMDILVVAGDRDLPRDAAQGYALVRALGASTRDHLVLSIESFDRQGGALLAHELTHQFMFELFPDASGGAAWITEALPDHHAGWDATGLAKLRQSMASGRIPDVARLTPLDRQWGHAVFDFVAAEYGARGVRAYLAALREAPASMRDPIRIAFDTTPAEFNAAFREFARARFGS